jgi:hypothetical protein
MKKPTNSKPELQLSGLDGNAFAVLARAREVARKAGWPSSQISDFTISAMHGDYDNLLAVCNELFNVK